jgi:hypothetical protein
MLLSPKKELIEFAFVTHRSNSGATEEKLRARRKDGSPEQQSNAERRLALSRSGRPAAEDLPARLRASHSPAVNQSSVVS